MMPLIKIENLHTYFYSKAKQAFVRAVDNVSMEVIKGKTLGIVGESGSGKSITMMSVMGLIGSSPGVISGTVTYHNGAVTKDLLDGLDRYVDIDLENGKVMAVSKDMDGWRKASEQQMKEIRGKHISIIFQNPKSAFNPFMTIGDQISEMVMLHTDVKDKSEAIKKAKYWMQQVKIDNPDIRYHNYPGALSGGLAQRAMIAMALASEPSLLIADEPTTGLDATIQAKILELLLDIKTNIGITIMIISHDIGVISALSDHVTVMYGGTVLEYGDANTVLSTESATKHPYTSALLASIPNEKNILENNGRLKAIDGEVLDTIKVANGCRFAPRCNSITDSVRSKCLEIEPELASVDGMHKVRCWLYQN